MDRGTFLKAAAGAVGALLLGKRLDTPEATARITARAKDAPPGPAWADDLDLEAFRCVVPSRVWVNGHEVEARDVRLHATVHAPGVRIWEVEIEAPALPALAWGGEEWERPVPVKVVHGFAVFSGDALLDFASTTHGLGPFGQRGQMIYRFRGVGPLGRSSISKG